MFDISSLRLFLLASLIVSAPLVRAAERPPNIVVILADDQGWGDLSIHENTNIETPHLDQLSRSGASFDRFFVSPVCAPTRAEFLTGRYHPRTGVRGVSTGLERLNLDETTIAQSLKSAGYTTGNFGKWHNGTQYPYHPVGRGFDEFYGFCSGHWGHYFDPVLEHNGEIVHGEGYITDDFTNKAISFVEKNASDPFFLYLTFCTPHSPFQVPDKYWDKFKDMDIRMQHRDPDKEDTDTTRAALAMVENLDWNVGRLMSKLEESGLAEDTIVVYFSDNGPNSWRWNDGMRGKKGTTDEGGVRVPCFISWPGKIPAGVQVSEIAGAIDLMPTLLELAGAENIGEKPVDGKSLVPLLSRKSASWPDRTILASRWGKVSVRSQGFRLDERRNLYDMRADPGQNKNLSKLLPEVTEQLKQVAERFKKKAYPGVKADDRPYPIGYREFPTTFLPARDATFTGGIQRSGRAPNCSYVKNWKSKDQSIDWNVEVNEPGKYQVTLFYTCASEDVGGEFEMAIGDHSLKSKIEKAHDPPLYGMEADRVERGSESYVKDFAAHEMGTIELTSQQGTLSLRALKIPGEEVAEVRGLRLVLLD